MILFFFRPFWCLIVSFENLGFGSHTQDLHGNLWDPFTVKDFGGWMKVFSIMASKEFRMLTTWQKGLQNRIRRPRVSWSVLFDDWFFYSFSSKVYDAFDYSNCYFLVVYSWIRFNLFNPLQKRFRHIGWPAQ